MQYPFLNSTVISQADAILRSAYPGGPAYPPAMDDQIARFFVSPVATLLFRNLMFLFLSSYIQNQVNFFQIHAPEYAYYMIPEWLLNRYLFHNLNSYSSAHYKDFLFITEDDVKVGERWGMMIVDKYNISCYDKKVYNCVLKQYWLDVKIKGNIELNRIEPPKPDKRAFTFYHLWLNKTATNLYHGAVLNSIAF